MKLANLNIELNNKLKITNETITYWLTYHATENPEKVAIKFITDSQEKNITYAVLLNRIYAVATYLVEHTEKGDRALLLFDNDDNYVVSFYACLFAGVVAVPIFPPSSAQEKNMSRLNMVIEDSKPTVALTTKTIKQVIEQSEDKKLPNFYVATDDIDLSLSEKWESINRGLYEDTFLQYTSGSTGNPKGVIVTHDNLIANEKAIMSVMKGTDSNDIFVSWLPLYHDMGLIGGLMQPLFRGMTLVLMSPMFFLRKPKIWLEAITKYKATISVAPDFAYRLCVDRVNEESIKELDLSSLKILMSGAEPIHEETLNNFSSYFSQCGFNSKVFSPCYGLAEATLLVTSTPLKSDMTVLTVSKKQLEKNEAKLVDESYDGDTFRLVSSGEVAVEHQISVTEPNTLRELADGTIGEILVSGPSVAKGYWMNDIETDKVFINHNGAKWLRTGDLGFLLDGQIYITGRIKDVIILNGRNLYPQDVEIQLESNFEVIRKGRAVAFSVTNPSSKKEGIGIAVEISFSMQKLINSETLINEIQLVVSEMCQQPASVVLLLNPKSIPKTSSGKLQRSACRQAWLDNQLNVYFAYEFGQFRDSKLIDTIEIQKKTHLVDKAKVSNQTPNIEDSVQEKLAVLWSSSITGLDVSLINKNSHFFVSGGDSIALVNLLSKINNEFDLNFPLAVLLQNLKISNMVSAIENHVKRLQTEIGVGSFCINPIGLEDKRKGVLLTKVQKGLLLSWCLNQQNNNFNVSGALRFEGSLDNQALFKATNELINKHEILRTYYKVDNVDLNNSKQFIFEQWEMEFGNIDLTSLNPNQKTIKLQKELVSFSEKPFKLDTELPIRFALFKESDEKSTFAISIHHIAADGWSVSILIQELTQMYNKYIRDEDVEIIEPSNKIDFFDYAAWKNSSLSETKLSNQLDFWRENLKNHPEILSLPYDYKRKNDYSTDKVVFTFNDELTFNLKTIATESGISLYSCIVALLSIVISYISNSHDISIGTPIADRYDKGTQSIIGCLINLLVLRTDVNPKQSFKDLMITVNDNLLQAQLNKGIDFGVLVEKLQPAREANTHPYVQIACIQNIHLNTSNSFAELDFELDELSNGTSDFDLSLDFTEMSDGIKFNLRYRLDLFSEETVHRISCMFKTVTEQITKNIALPIHQLQFINPTEAITLITQGTNPKSHAYSKPVHELISEQAEQTPDSIAIESEQGNLTYQELETQSNQLANLLIKQGISIEDRIGIYVNRSPNMVVGLLGILKAGATYIPIDPSLPKSRIDYMIEDSGLATIVTQQHLANDISQHNDINIICIEDSETEEATQPSVVINQENSAYIIYTSGTTGNPKGVVIAHGSLYNFLNSMKNKPGMTKKDKLLAVTSLSFDIAGLELYLPLVLGSQLYLATKEEVLDGVKLGNIINQHNISIMQATPSGWRLLLDSNWKNDSNVRLKALCGGEAVPHDLVEKLQTNNVESWNLYGPTETTIWSTAQSLNTQDINIGRPISNTQTYILDNDLKLVVNGITGELYLGGKGLARGYLNRASLTSEKFIANPFSDKGERLYRTGDLARWNEDGQLEYLGRTDHQVKIRGYRIELGEIENAINNQPTIKQSIVIAQEQEHSSRLIGYIVKENSDEILDTQELQVTLKEQLPDYMVPSIYVELDSIPLNTNGKVDRKALPEPDMISSQSYQAPEGEIEEKLAQIWQDVLNVEKVGRNDNFFELGGDSISGLRVISLIDKELKTYLAVRLIFERSTITQLAQDISSNSHKSSSVLSDLDSFIDDLI